MMGLSGRDPIFFAQLDTETTVHRHLAGIKNRAAFVQDTCLSCHGVMGQRQFHIDNPGPNKYFTLAQVNNPRSRYGALARDGVSCMVCHHMSDQNLGDPSTYTGKFKLGPANVVYGPYPSGDSDVKIGDNVIRRPMLNAVGIAPVFGAQVGESKMCASCHTIVLPVYDARGDQVIEDGVAKTEVEQATYLEWLNSSSASSNQSCQDCHMPDNFKGVPLQFPIANIEDSTFPVVPDAGPQTSLPTDQLILQTRDFYPRHQLLGINVFVLEMFDQFRTDLGLYKTDGLLPPPLRDTYNGQANAVDGAVYQAQNLTAQVSIASLSATGGQLQADVLVRNLAGHKFPSGVSFRRAFLDFQVLDAQGNVLWESGGTNADGVITDTAGKPLVTEFFSQSQQTFQPHFWVGNPITSDKQVEIYEELERDPQGQLTTSFLSLDQKVKDNRLLPQGWSPSGPDADITAPVGTGADPSYQHGCGCSVVRYQLPLSGALANAAQVQATLYYQSIPPYYLRQRAQDGHGPATARLIDFVNQLDVNKYTEISNWKLKIASSGAVTIP